MTEKPKVQGKAAEELVKAEKQFDAFDAQIKDLTLDRMNTAPKEEVEQQTKMSTREMQKSNDIYLKPHKTIGVRDKFNERFRADWNFDKEYVQFIYEHKECPGETLDIWTRKYGGIPAEEWLVPANKPVWGPRYLAEQIAKMSYHRLVMVDRPISDGTTGTLTHQMVVDSQVQRLTAYPVSQKKSIFMGANSF